MLELALELVECNDPKAGEPLTDYEKHIMVSTRALTPLIQQGCDKKRAKI
jgi:hypothetical protein